MCRFAAYLGHPLLLSQLITEPDHSLIHQSYQSRERPMPLNGDGFGVAWFAPAVSQTPALFKDISPAWNNDNLRELARVTSSRCILAHVRAASPRSTVQRLNCHPFAAGNLAFMHNGSMAAFSRWRRPLLSSLSDAAFEIIQGSTDSEHAFGILWDVYCCDSRQDPLERLAASVVSTIQRLEELKAASGVTESCDYNFALADGHRLVATRYSSAASDPPPSLHYTSGRHLRCQSGTIQLEEGDPNPDVVFIASEETCLNCCWSELPVNSMILAQHPGQVEIRPIVM